ncbi:putative D-glucarate or D-galactorate regulator, GntR family [Candidatus Burkholderia verschuerenii]|uniref:Putative D-glucarate or D-galactorate regulator, GntR family n=1 Tax=Candidatus Burkholderia verschuerenii TaxID=242163 RepID=A0A0L0M6S2_9BURK|nr:FadR/GntR family transcriptional regulator [Candidatus Burkholderia verschuerenii]KND58000.1 putative D-glucarate or D-galactorate regulator, GntR family [Candidatus Burkholderia verschuerenii]
MSSALASDSLRRSRNLTEEVVAELTERIRGGALQPGDKLPTESEIMAQLGVSRTVVRESISRLQAARLVQTRHGIGTFVLEAGDQDRFQIEAAGELTVRDVMAILELRISLEAEAAGLAAMRRTDENLAQMHHALDEFERHIAQGTGNAVAADVAFHLELAKATGNRYFHSILSQLGNTIIPRTRVNSAALAHNDPSGYLDRVNREHEDIYDAIERRDPEAARAAMRMHLSNSRERLRRAQEASAKTSDAA